jgi:hypothetical protein
MDCTGTTAILMTQTAFQGCPPARVIVRDFADPEDDRIFANRAASGVRPELPLAPCGAGTAATHLAETGRPDAQRPAAR